MTLGLSVVLPLLHLQETLLFWPVFEGMTHFPVESMEFSAGFSMSQIDF